MNPVVYLVALVVAFVLDTELAEVARIGSVIPLTTPVVAVFIALHAPRRVTIWACLALGLLLDFADVAMLGDRPYVVPGPYALGFAFGANLVLPLRATVNARNPLTLGVLTFFFIIAAALVRLAIWSIRSWYPDVVPPLEAGGVLAELWRQFLVASWSALFALASGWILIRTTSLWGFPGSMSVRR